jgi:hypothetical protein
MKLLSMQFPPIAVTSSLLGPNILLSTLFSNTLSLCPSLNVRDQVSYPYRTTDKSSRSKYETQHERIWKGERLIKKHSKSKNML